MVLIVVTGPTGVGKTELCLSIAEHFGIDIINADSRQIYSEIPIGTAAPTTQQMQRVRHHFVGTHHIGDYYSASMYEEDVMELLSSMEKHPSTGEANGASAGCGHEHDVALLTGGSMMYIDAVCNGIDDIPTIKEDIRATMKQRLHEEGLPALADELCVLDPEYWAIVDRNNPRRVVHALEICHQSGQTYTSFRKGKRKTRPFRILKIGLTRDKVAKVKCGQVIMDHSELYDRINSRVLEMIDCGLVEETHDMLPFRNEKALNTIGYKELFQYFDGEIPFDEAVKQIQSHSREYARKQLTWFKKDKEMKWFHPDKVTEIIEYIEKSIIQ